MTHDLPIIEDVATLEAQLEQIHVNLAFARAYAKQNNITAEFETDMALLDAKLDAVAAKIRYAKVVIQYAL